MPLVPTDESDADDENVCSAEERSNGSSHTDSLNLDEEEEEVEEGGSGSGMACRNNCSLRCCHLSDRLVGRRFVLHIDQTPSVSGSRSSMSGNQDGSSNDNNDSDECPPLVSASTSLSDTASDNMSTRATLGDAISIPGTEEYNNNGEDSIENPSEVPDSLVDAEQERVRRIHNSIFSSLEQDLAELVRIREETIQFLESGVRPTTEEEERNGGLISSTARMSLDESGGRRRATEASSAVRETYPDPDHDPPEELQRNREPFVLRERLTFQSRPRCNAAIRSRTAPSSMMENSAGGDPRENINTIRMDGRTYTPTGDYANSPPALPAKPGVNVGLTCCEEKAVAARKLLDKLQYGDPEDEGACFVRRFWRETSTLEENVRVSPSGSGPSGLSVDIAAIAERTASLEASLEEAFDGIRLRLREMRPNDGGGQQSSAEGGGQTGGNSEGGGGSGDGGTSTNNNTDNNNENDGGGSSVPYYQAWDQETSILDNPLNYDIWDELEGGNDAGPIITARINMAERASNSTRDIRRHNISRPNNNNNNNSNSVSVGTGPMEGAELDDDTTDDEEVSDYFQIRNLTSSHSSPDGGRCGRAFLAEMGVSDALGQELMDMFSFSEDEFTMPSPNSNSNGANNTPELEELPLPLFNPREEDHHANDNDEQDGRERDERDDDGGNSQDGVEAVPEDQDNNEEADNEDVGTLHISFCPNQQDDCSVRVYLDEHDLNFSLQSLNQLQTRNQEREDGERERDQN